jgi:hypothetical protein
MGCRSEWRAYIHFFTPLLIRFSGVLSKHGTSTKRPWTARKTAFFDSGQSALVCFLESHEVYVMCCYIYVETLTSSRVAYQVDAMTQKWSHQLPTRMYVANIIFINVSLTSAVHLSGHATLSADERMLIVSNLQDGVDIYSMPPVQLLRSFKHAISVNVPLQVHSALQGALTLAGSDDGTVRLFEQRTGQVSELLPHGNGEYECRCSLSLRCLSFCSRKPCASCNGR